MITNQLLYQLSYAGMPGLSGLIFIVQKARNANQGGALLGFSVNGASECCAFLRQRLLWFWAGGLAALQYPVGAKLPYQLILADTRRQSDIDVVCRDIAISR